MEKHFEFTATKQGDAVKRLDIEVLATLAGGEQLCAEQEQALTSLEPELAELKRDSVTLDALAKHVCAVLKARPLEPDAIIAAGNADTGDATASSHDIVRCHRSSLASVGRCPLVSCERDLDGGEALVCKLSPTGANPRLQSCSQ